MYLVWPNTNNFFVCKNIVLHLIQYYLCKQSHLDIVSDDISIKLTLEVVIGYSSMGAVALDDILMSSRPTAEEISSPPEDLYTCTFNDGTLCSWATDNTTVSWCCRYVPSHIKIVFLCELFNLQLCISQISSLTPLRLYKPFSLTEDWLLTILSKVAGLLHVIVPTSIVIYVRMYAQEPHSYCASC